LTGMEQVLWTCHFMDENDKWTFYSTGDCDRVYHQRFSINV